MKESIIVSIIFMVIALGVSFRGIFADETVAKKSLEKQEYSKILVIDKSFFLVGLRGCDEKDAAKFTVRAVNPVGKKVEIYVCTGWPFKGATIRTD